MSGLYFKNLITSFLPPPLDLGSMTNVSYLNTCQTSLSDSVFGHTMYKDREKIEARLEEMDRQNRFNLCCFELSLDLSAFNPL